MSVSHQKTIARPTGQLFVLVTITGEWVTEEIYVVLFVIGMGCNKRGLKHVDVPHLSELPMSNDLVSNIQHCIYFLYADDIVRFKALRKNSSKIDIDLFKQDIVSIERWCLKNELTINIKQTKLQFFPDNRNTDCNQFENEVICQMYNQNLAYKRTFKYLGVDMH